VQEINIEHDKQECLNNMRPQKELQKRAEIQPNPHNSSKTLRQYNIQGTNEIYTISTITNGQLSRKVLTMTSNQRATLLREKKLNTDKRYASPTHTNHNLLLIGDSHVRGLAEKIS
jgi:hypothetical protein